jgi:hypothetical protein
MEPITPEHWLLWVGPEVEGTSDFGKQTLFIRYEEYASLQVYMEAIKEKEPPLERLYFGGGATFCPAVFVPVFMDLLVESFPDLSDVEIIYDVGIHDLLTDQEYVMDQLGKLPDCVARIKIVLDLGLSGVFVPTLIRSDSNLPFTIYEPVQSMIDQELYKEDKSILNYIKGEEDA